MKRPKNKFGDEIWKNIFLTPLLPRINREKWLEKVKVDKVQYKPIISETVKAR